MKLLLIPFKVLWWLIKVPLEILGFIFKNASVKSGGMFN